MQMFSLYSCSSCKKNKINELYEIGAERLESDFDIAAIIKDLKTLKTVVYKNFPATDLVEAEHSADIVIDLDYESSDSGQEKESFHKNVNNTNTLFIDENEQ